MCCNLEYLICHEVYTSCKSNAGLLRLPDLKLHVTLNVLQRLIQFVKFVHGISIICSLLTAKASLWHNSVYKSIVIIHGNCFVFAHTLWAC